MLGELNKYQIEQVLQTQAIGRIGIHADERRYVVPVTYVFDKDSVYAHSREGLKIRMMCIDHRTSCNTSFINLK
jgi:nitroimidazol reductase NimA-like FMN-containing flavoprotein (pyridoxamine 5'-phosphate oxidase superfamily)